MKILIAVPCMDMVPTQFMLSILGMDKPEGTGIHVNTGALVYDSRNLITLYAIENGYTHVMWIDSDVLIPKDTIPRMLKDMEELNAEFITGLYVKRAFPTEPVLYSTLLEPQANQDGIMEKRIETFTDYPKNSRFKVSGCGMGCAMTTVNLLAHVWHIFGPAFNLFPWAGEDQSFCYRVKLLHKDIWCDSSISCGHVGQFVYSEKLLNRGDEI